MTILDKINQFIKSHSLVSPGEKIIIAVSGGPDSVALLYALNNLRYQLGINIHVAHFNHGLRPGADQDQRFVRSLCSSLNLPLSTEKKKIAQKHQSLEEAARESRFRFLCAVAKKYHSRTIALGHTHDDLAETVLMRIIRGTGLLGMSSILPKRIMYEKTFIRPLLCLSRKEVLRFLKQQGARFRTDPSNFKKDFFRNKIRLELFPLLEKSYNPQIKDVLAGLSQTALADYDYLSAQGQKMFKKIGKFSASHKTMSLDLKRLKTLDLAIKRIVLRLAIEKVHGNTRRLTLSHILEVEKLLSLKPTDQSIHLPFKIRISYHPKKLVIYKD